MSKLVDRAIATIAAHGRNVALCLRAPAGSAYSAAETGHAPHAPMVIADILRDLGVRSIRSVIAEPAPENHGRSPRAENHHHDDRAYHRMNSAPSPGS